MLLVGLALIGTGLLLFTQTPVDGRYLTDLLPALLALGVGGGLSFPTMMTLAMSDATRDDAGLASGLVNTTAQVGGAIGLAVLAALSTARTESLLGNGVTRATALTDGFHLAFGVGAALVIAALAIAVTVLRPAELPAAIEAVDEIPARAEPAYSEAA